MYSPKHRSGRCSFHPIRQDRRKDTAAYASLPSQQCQRANLVPEPGTDKEPRTAQPSLPEHQTPKLPGVSRQNRAADEVVLLEPLPWVNTFFEEIFSKLAFPSTVQVFRQASAFAEAYSPLRWRHPDPSIQSECFHLVVRGALETCHILASMARAVDRDQERSRSGPEREARSKDLDRVGVVWE